MVSSLEDSKILGVNKNNNQAHFYFFIDQHHQIFNIQTPEQKNRSLFSSHSKKGENRVKKCFGVSISLSFIDPSFLLIFL